MKTKFFAQVPGSPTKGEDQIKITSRWCGKVYVSRLVKSTNRWSSRRYLIDEDAIRQSDADFEAK